MNLHFRLSRDLQAHDIRFPFPVTWISTCGAHVFSHRGNRRVSGAGGQWHIPAEELFSVSVSPGVEGHASGSLSFSSVDLPRTAEPDWDSLEQVFRTRSRPFGLALAQAIFLQPERDWSLQETSDAIHVSERDIRTRLFREDYGFASTVRRCRALHLLLGSLCDDFPQPSMPPHAMLTRQRADSLLSRAFSVRLSTLSKFRLPVNH
jgi:hypothetical protein